MSAGHVLWLLSLKIFAEVMHFRHAWRVPQEILEGRIRMQGLLLRCLWSVKLGLGFRVWGNCLQPEMIDRLKVNRRGETAKGYRKILVG